MPLGQLQAAMRNPKQHSSEIGTSIGRFGYVEPILLDERTGRIVAGHGRREALLAMHKRGEAPPAGIRAEGDEWLVPVLRGWASRSDAEAEAYLLASNKLVEAGGWDNQMLAELLKDLNAQDALDGVGFTDAEFEALLSQVDGIGAGAGTEGLTDPDAVPEEPEEADVYVKSGELWMLGKHRLLCGDVARLMDGKRADLCLTDPPYGIGEDYESHDDTQENLRRLAAGFFTHARAASDVVLLTPGNVNQRHYPKPEWTLAWFVPAGTGSGPWGFSCWQPVLAYGKDPYLAAGKGRRPDALVKTEASDQSLSHPCPKPVGVWIWLMERGSLEGALVLDPFSGSGTSLIAAEKTGRRCCALELEPKYVQVAVERWQSFTGRKAERV
jgi:predicted RNA methylase